MARTPIWKSISDSLRDEIAAGHYVPGDKLPTEAELSARFGVNRHTIRHALSALIDDGLVASRRGSGVFVTARPTPYALGRRVRFHENLEAAGQQADKQILRLETRPADKWEAENLALHPGEDIHLFESLSLADGSPIALSLSRFPAARFPGLPASLMQNTSVTAALAADGVTDFTRQSTALTAKRASATHALHLNIREGDPILRTVSINVDGKGIPVEFGHTWFAGDRVTLTVTPD